MHLLMSCSTPSLQYIVDLTKLGVNGPCIYREIPCQINTRLPFIDL